jgi:hypothetical protein
MVQTYEVVRTRTNEKERQNLMAMAKRLTAKIYTTTSWHLSIYKGCPLIPIPIELVTEDSKHADENRVGVDIES